MFQDNLRFTSQSPRVLCLKLNNSAAILKRDSSAFNINEDRFQSDPCINANRHQLLLAFVILVADRQAVLQTKRLIHFAYFPCHSRFTGTCEYHIYFSSFGFWSCQAFLKPTYILYIFLPTYHDLQFFK